MNNTEYLNKILSDMEEIVEETTCATFAEAQDLLEDLKELQSNMVEVLSSLVEDHDT